MGRDPPPVDIPKDRSRLPPSVRRRNPSAKSPRQDDRGFRAFFTPNAAEQTKVGPKVQIPFAPAESHANGKPFSRGHLYKLLSNPIYAGQIAHKGQLFPYSRSRMSEKGVRRDKAALSSGCKAHPAI